MAPSGNKTSGLKVNDKMKTLSSDIAMQGYGRPSRYRVALAVVGVLFLAGCSSVPDAVNPVEWYKGARDLVSSDEKAEAPESGNPPNQLVAERGQAAPGADQPTPNLNTVPDRPVSTSRAEREEIRQGLVADRQQTRRYSSEVISRQGSAVNPLRPAGTKEASAPPAVAAAAPPSVSPPPSAAPAPPPRPPAPVVAQPAAPSPPVAAARPPAPPIITTPGPARIAQAPTASTAPTAQSRRPASPQAMARIQTQRRVPAAQETIIVSSAGVQNIGTLNSARSPLATPRNAGNLAAGGSSAVPGVRSLSEFTPSGAQGSYQVATILFKNGSARLGARDRRIIRQVVAQHKQVGGTIRVVGHASHRTKLTDMVSHKIANLRISTTRAEVVAKELVRLGARPSNLYIGAASDSEPRYLEHMPSGEAGNRRADIYIDF